MKKDFILKSCADFVLETVHTPNVNEAICLEQTEERLDRIYLYAMFLKQPLNIGMFVPCDLKGNVLEEPGLIPSKELKEYREAKERVLFKNCTFDGIDIIINNSVRICSSALTKDLTIEFLIYSKISLTKSAIKQFM